MTRLAWAILGTVALAFAAAALLAARLVAQTPAVLEPERWLDPDYPVACYRFPGDMAAACVVLPTEDDPEEETDG